jgi:peptidyl-prolyl cis-trans isomerase C
VAVKTRFGYHVLRLDRRIGGAQLPFEAVRERIAAYLREHVWRRAVSQYLQLLVGQAEIEGIELNGASSPLVQ